MQTEWDHHFLSRSKNKAEKETLYVVIFIKRQSTEWGKIVAE